MKTKVDSPKECKYDAHDFFQLTAYSIGQHTLGGIQQQGFSSQMTKLACRKCGKVIAV